ncbi:MAG: hypothetical protein ABGY71_11370 [bacterium]|nr:hypothetical protein [Planctomycetota bacterium]HIL51591.1 hypothetical protein [Planctomycetota bacterium]
MNRTTIRQLGWRAATSVSRPLLVVGTCCGLILAATAQDRTYTTDADFDLGTYLEIEHPNASPGQLELVSKDRPLPFVSVANAGNGTLVRIDSLTGQIVGEYRSAPEGEAQDPSRATVAPDGNTWMGNRSEDIAGIEGSLVKVGLVVGGTRVDASGSPDSQGQFLAPPYCYSTAVDRDGDGLIRTSRGLGDVLSWPPGSDGAGGACGSALVQDALDECLLVFQKTPSVPNVRGIAIDAAGDVWAAGYSITPVCLRKLNGNDGACRGALVCEPCGGYGSVIDSGVLWSVSPNQRSLLRFDGAATPPGTCINFSPTSFTPRGVAVDAGGTVWVAGGGEVRRLNASGSETGQFPVAGASNLHGLTILPSDQSIWVAGFASNTVYRLDNSGALIAVISVGVKPNGVAVDGQGKIWVSNQGSDDVSRINPLTNSVDFSVALGGGSQPFNPSDMTGSGSYQGIADGGNWSVVTDGGEAGVQWNRVSWNAGAPTGTALVVEVRASETEVGLASESFAGTGNGSGVAIGGRFLEVRVTFQGSSTSCESPALFDLTVEGDSGSEPNACNPIDRRTAGSLLLFPEFDNAPGILTLLTVTHVDCDSAGDIAVEFVYIDGNNCQEFNRTEVLSACDTLALLTCAHNPNGDRGFVYAFAKDATTGEPVAHNALIGAALQLDGLEAFEYSTNAVAFEGLGGTSGTDLDGDGLLDLNGLEYSQAPESLLVPRFLGQDGAASGVAGELVMIALSGGSQFITTLDFAIYNDNEERFSAEHSFHCWEKCSLLDISGAFGNSFLAGLTNHSQNEILGAPARESGWFQIDGAVAHSQTTSIENPAFYAVLIERVGAYAAADLPFELCSQSGGVLLPHSLSGQ